MDRLLNFFKMLSDETRLRIIMLLYHEKLCVCEICGILNISQPKVSKHLGKLRDMGFVKDERKEQFIFYHLSLDDSVMTEMIQRIADNLEKYPVIQKDIEGIVEKETFLKQCKR